MIRIISKDKRSLLNVVFFILLSIWWIYLQFVAPDPNDQRRYFFGAAYGVVALLGSIWGFQISKQWGGVGSILGKAIFFLALGLLAEEFGQIVFSYYNIVLNVEVPYPSLADLGFFANIPFYIIGTVFLIKAAGGVVKIQNPFKILQVIFLPTLLLTFSYMVFLREHSYDLTDPLTSFLDFAYPLGQAFYLSLAFLTYSLSRNLLGGVMKNKILLLIFAFFCQYAADYNFLYQNSRGTWVNGGYGDYLYLIAYFIMTIGLLQMNSKLIRTKEV